VGSSWIHGQIRDQRQHRGCVVTITIGAITQGVLARIGAIFFDSRRFRNISLIELHCLLASRQLFDQIMIGACMRHTDLHHEEHQYHENQARRGSQTGNQGWCGSGHSRSLAVARAVIQLQTAERRSIIRFKQTFQVIRDRHRLQSTHIRAAGIADRHPNLAEHQCRHDANALPKYFTQIIS